MSTAAQAPRPNVQAVLLSVAVSTQAAKLPPTTPAESTAAQVSMSNALRTPQTTNVGETAARRMQSWFRSHWRGRFGRSRSQWMLGFPLAANLAETGTFRTNLPQDFEHVQTYAPDAFGTASELSKGPVRARASSKSTSYQCLDFA